MNAHVFILILLASAFIPEIVYIYKLLTKNISIENLSKITIRMNITIVILAFLLMGVAVIFDINYLKYKKPIEYSKWEEIEWSDFRAIKRPKQTLYGDQNFAFICTEISYRFKNDILEIKTLFHPARSYTFNKKKAGKLLLEHELYHLHITEYWARELRKKVSNLNDKSNKKKIKSLIKEYKIKERNMQYQYDEETYHGYVLGMQKKWQNKIDSCLIFLEKYSKPIINLKKNENEKNKKN